MSKLYMRAAALAAAAVTAAGVASAPAAVAAGHPAGPLGSSVVIASKADIVGNYDVAANAAGTAYIAWIANSSAPNFRQVHLCTLPVAARTCSGGVQTINTHGPSASDIRVLAGSTGKVTLVWFDNGPDAINGPQGGEILTATAMNGLNLSAPSVVASAPSFGEMLDAEFSPGGSLYTIAYAGVDTKSIQVRAAVPGGTLTTLATPYSVGMAKLAFSGNTPIIALSKYGAVSSPAGWSSRSSSGKWSSFANVPLTWTTGGIGLTKSAHGVRLIATVNNASYHPVIAAWNGNGFSTRALTADTNNCGPSSHDATTDPSGRVLDVSWECNDVTIANYSDGQHAAIQRIHTQGTPTFAPAIAAGTRGVATVAWSNEAKPSGSDLHVSRVQLSTSTTVVHGHATGGGVYLTGPTSCLPAVQTPVGVRAAKARGWTALRHSLTLGSTPVTAATLDGADLTSGKTYTLHGAAVFGKGSARSIARVDLTFRAC